MKPRPPSPTVADLAAEIRALPAVVAFEAAQANLVTLEARVRELAARLENESLRTARTRSPDDHHRPAVSALVVGAPARATSPGPLALTPDELEALKAQHDDVRAAVRQQREVIGSTLSPAARRAAAEHTRPFSIEDLKAARDLVLAFDAGLKGRSRVYEALEAVGLGTGAAPVNLPSRFDAARSGQDGLTTSERIQLEIDNLEKHGTSNPAPPAPPSSAKRKSEPTVEPVY